jgi:hypothetical protein
MERGRVFFDRLDKNREEKFKMNFAKGSIIACLSWAPLIVVVSMLLFGPTTSYGQNAQNAVMSGATSETNSYALVDLTPYINTSVSTICEAITAAFSAYASSKRILVDARGLTGSALTCLAGDANPWATSPGPAVSTVLLPAGAITIRSTWILGTNDSLIGEGPNLTVITAGSSFTGSDIIDMGGSGTMSNANLYCPLGSSPPVWDCQGVVIEHLGVQDGTTQGLNGIVNMFSEELSRVNDVTLSMGSGIGLWLGTYYVSGSNFGNPNNSGPYSNISFSGSGICVKIGGPSITRTQVNETRGIHGLSCSSSASTGAVVYLDGTNNSIEDAYIAGSGADGILIGSLFPAQTNLLFNVTGSGLASVVHISSSSSNVADLTLMGITNVSSTNTIRDDLTSSGTPLDDSNVGLYMVGEAVPNSSGYSRFTTSTSPNFPTWIVGPNAPPTSCSATSTGSLFSCTSTACGGTLWGCAGSTWTLVH